MYALSARLFALTAIFLSAVASPVPADGDHPDWSQVYIDGYSYAGSGCPAGSVAGTFAPDGSFLNLAFDQYSAQVYPGSKPGESRKNCQISFNLHYPPGWSLTFFDTTYFGYIDLDKKVTAKQTSSYRWGGSKSTATFFSTWVGDIDETYTFTDTLEQSAYVWSPCKGKGASSSLVINTSIQTENSKNKKGSGLITTDAIEGLVRQKYGCTWKKC